MAAAVLVAVLAAGLSVHLLLPDTTATDIAGDALYAAAVYLLVAAVGPRAPSLVVGAIALGWCVAVELLQLTGLPERLAAVVGPAVLVLGTVFDMRDLLVYAVVAAAAVAVDVLVRRLGARRSPQRDR